MIFPNLLIFLIACGNAADAWTNRNSNDFGLVAVQRLWVHCILPYLQAQDLINLIAICQNFESIRHLYFSKLKQQNLIAWNRRLLFRNANDGCILTLQPGEFQALFILRFPNTKYIKIFALGPKESVLELNYHSSTVLIDPQNGVNVHSNAKEESVDQLSKLVFGNFHRNSMPEYEMYQPEKRGLSMVSKMRKTRKRNIIKKTSVRAVMLSYIIFVLSIFAIHGNDSKINASLSTIFVTLCAILVKILRL